MKVHIIGLVLLMVVGCGQSGGTPTSPSGTTVESIRLTPDAAGLVFSTDFQIEAVGTFPSGTQFRWNFGDGSSTTTTTRTTSHVYSQTGLFGLALEVASGSRTTTSSRQVSVRSLAGRWSGTMTGHTHVPRDRPIPITSFQLTINNAPPPDSNGSARLDAAWADDAGCRHGASFAPILQTGMRRQPSTNPSLSLEHMVCNDRQDLGLSGTADAAFNRVEGTCSNGGANCRFQMIRQ